MRSRMLRGVVFFCFAVAVVVGFKVYNKGKAGSEIKAQAVEVVQGFPEYNASPVYYDSLVEYAHPLAFDLTYEMGGRRTSAKFDADAYLRSLYGHMADKAQRDGRKEVAALLLVRRQLLPKSGD